MNVNRCISDAGSNRVQQYNDGWPHDVFGPSFCRSIVPAPQRILPASCLPDCQGFVLTSPLLLLTSSSSSSLLQLQLHIRRARQCELRIDPGSVISAAWDLTSCRSAIRCISANGRRRSTANDYQHIAFSTPHRQVHRDPADVQAVQICWVRTSLRLSQPYNGSRSAKSKTVGYSCCHNMPAIVTA